MANYFYGRNYFGYPFFLTGFGLLGVGTLLFVLPNLVRAPEEQSAQEPELATIEKQKQESWNTAPQSQLLPPPVNIFEAAQRGTLQDVQMFANNTPNINVRSSSGKTPLLYAVRYNTNVAVVRCLISQGANVNAKDTLGKTSLDIADTEEKKQVLREAGGKSKSELPEDPDVSENAASVMASIVNRQQEWQATSQQPTMPQPPTETFQSNFKDIFEAAGWGTVNDVRYFFERGADINARDNDGRTPLHVAASDSRNADALHVLRYLVSQGADVHARDNGGELPLHTAARWNPNLEVLKYLFSLGGDINVRSNEGQTLLHKAAADNSNVEVLRYLVSLGADVNAGTGRANEYTPTHSAARFNPNPEILRYLISQGASVNTRNSNGSTPLDDAATEEKRAILQAAGGRSGR